MFNRYATAAVKAALEDTRVVLIEGPRQAGKTTLVQQLATKQRRYLTLDDPVTCSLARSDPTTFVRNLDYAAIDEVQRAPELLLAIKQSVDKDGRPGRFLLTGSANILSMVQVADSLAGRMETIRLLPLAQTEILATASSFLKNAFAGTVAPISNFLMADDLIQCVLKGGYPEALARRSWQRRYRWQETYIQDLVRRDVQDLAKIEDLAVMPRLLQVLAHHSAQLVNYSNLGASVQLNYKTAQRYINIFEQMYLIRSLPPWSTNRLSRLVKAPKLHFLDSGLLAVTQNIDPQALVTDRQRFGPILETFVFGELLKLCSWFPRHVSMYHFRDKQQAYEVDIVLEGPGGAIVGIEVKAAATATLKDFRGLQELAKASGKNFKLGLLLYDHDVVVPFADNIFAAPLSCLWN
jgi:predicted AAA+ superfamily ATPase